MAKDNNADAELGSLYRQKRKAGKTASETAQ